MAAKLKVVKGGKGTKTNKSKTKSGKKNGAAGVGHNSATVDGKILKSYFMDLDAAHDKAEELQGTAMKRIGDLYEKASSETGVPKRLIISEYKRRRSEEKRLRKEKEMEPSELNLLTAMRGALGPLEDTPLGRAAIKAAKTASEIMGPGKAEEDGGATGENADA